MKRAAALKSPRLPPGAREAVRTRLLPWFQASARQLPWREDRSPYRVWISEAMLQQTRVDTVTAYFERWMRRFPDLPSLAAAEQEEVLKLWEGLGYYARARNLHKAARLMMERHGGRVPEDPEALRRLPGIGPYTLAAVSSLAFGRPLPVLDGNVERVLCRLGAVEAELGAPGVKPALLRMAGRLMGDLPPGMFNEAMMELGATVCTPRRPACPRCPLAGVCRARAKNPPDYPRRAARKSIPTVEVGAAVTWREDGRFLIAKRHEGGLLGGMWEFPGGKREPGERMEDCVRRELLEETGLRVRAESPLVRIRHTYSHFHLDMEVWTCRWQGEEPRTLDCAELRWVSPADCLSLPFGMADRKVFPHLVRPDGAGGLIPPR